MNSGDRLLTVLSALANPHRLRIVAALHEGSTYVSQLARDLEMSRPLVHMHLKKLADAGLVQGETTIADDGKAHRYFVVTDFAWLVDPVSIADAAATLTTKETEKKGQDDG